MKSSARSLSIRCVDPAAHEQPQLSRRAHAQLNGKVVDESGAVLPA
jgi:hypothetical protein